MVEVWYMAKNRNTRVCAAGIIERSDNHILIQRDATDADSMPCWRFPRGKVQKDESPEAGMRRIAEEIIGAEVEVVVGQPPLFSQDEDEPVEYRFFFCCVATGDLPDEEDDPEIKRWILKAHLREYEFDEVSKPVADWLVET